MVTNLPENNIIASTSATFNTNPLGYAYQYDQLNRLKAALGYTNMIWNNSGTNNSYSWGNTASNPIFSNTFAYRVRQSSFTNRLKKTALNRNKMNFDFTELI